MSEKVAIIVLSHNAWDISRKFLEHMRKNTDLDKIKLVWIDNGSSDNTPNNLEEYSHDVVHKKIINNSNKGVIDGRNQGFDWFLNDDDAKDCGYLMFLDNDQFVKDGWLEHHLSVLNSGYGLIGVEAWVMLSNFLPVGKVESLKKRFTYVGCGGSLMTREVPEKIGSYDPIFNPSYFEDPDYVFRAIRAGFKVGWNYNAKIDHLPHQTLGNMPDKQQRFLNSFSAFKKKWRGKKSPDLMQRTLPQFERDWKPNE